MVVVGFVKVVVEILELDVLEVVVAILELDVLDIEDDTSREDVTISGELSIVAKVVVDTCS